MSKEDEHPNKLQHMKTVIIKGKRKLYFGKNSNNKLKYNWKFKNNSISTTKYNPITWIPKGLLFQFMRAANIYFLLICILSGMYFSPKGYMSMVGTFVMILIFTLLKEGYEV